MSDYSFIIDNMTWSFSRMTTFENCKYEWYLQYIEEAKGESNFYGQFGKFCHVILEKYARGELGMFELVDYYDEHFDEEVPTTVYNKTTDVKEKYRNLGHEYFENIDLDLSKYEVLGIEEKCDFELNGNRFIGFIDLLLKDKKNGDIIVLDHKSSDYPYGKRGKLLKSAIKKHESYKRQLYLYCIYVYNKYGIYPKKIAWNYYKSQKWEFLDFDINEYEDTKKWALDILEEIKDENEFAPHTDFYYCHNLCACRNKYCEYKNYQGEG